MTLSPKQRQQLKAKAHKLNPVVMLGNQGLTAAVNKEIDRALNDHELIKIKIVGDDREARKAVVVAICEAQKAELVQQIGKIVVIYRSEPRDA